MKNRLFAQQACQPRLAGAGLTGDEDRPPANGETDLVSVVLTPEDEASATHLAGRQARLLRHPPNVVGHGDGSRASDDLVGHRPQRGAAPLDRDTDFARIEQIVVVFGVADADRVVDRDPQREERLAQAGGLCHRLRQHHQATAIEREDERLLERPDDLENRAGPLGIGLHDRLAGRERDATPLKFFEGRPDWAHVR